MANAKYKHDIFDATITNGYIALNGLSDTNSFVMTAFCSNYVLLPFSANGLWYALVMDGSGKIVTTGKVIKVTAVYYK